MEIYFKCCPRCSGDLMEDSDVISNIPFLKCLQCGHIVENVQLPLIYSEISQSIWEEKSLKAIKTVSLEHRLEHQSAQLSGGEKQRVAIARALVNKPAVIFADEPTGNLDSHTGQTVMSFLKNLNRKEGKTIIMVTHDSNIAHSADKIEFLKDGTIVKS